MSKGEETRERILESAVRLASRDGLSGLTIAGLASETGLSKSGLFAHFGSKDALELQVLEAAIGMFRDTVVRPALKAPRGEARLRAFFERWLAWGDDPRFPGGCLIVAAASELDDKPGPARDYLVAAQKDLLTSLARTVKHAAEVGYLRADVSPDEVAFHLYALILGYHHARRLLADPRSSAFVHAAFERLIDALRPR